MFGIGELINEVKELRKEIAELKVLVGGKLKETEDSLFKTEEGLYNFKHRNRKPKD